MSPQHDDMTPSAAEAPRSCRRLRPCRARCARRTRPAHATALSASAAFSRQRPAGRQAARLRERAARDRRRVRRPFSCPPIWSPSATTRTKSASSPLRRCSARRCATLAGRDDHRTVRLSPTAACFLRVLMVATGLGFAGLQGFWPLLVVGFIGTLNPAAGDVSVFVPLEQSLLARLVADKDRTALFARYSLAGSLMGACGTLMAALPELGGGALRNFHARRDAGDVRALRRDRAWRRRHLCADRTHRHAAARGRSARRWAASRGIVYRLSALFCVDSFGSGFFAQSILVLWLFQRFDLPVAQTASIFFWANLLHRGVVPRRRAVVAPHRADQHHGVHAHPREPGAGGDPVRRRLRDRDRSCCCFARCCRRWTCRRAPPTSWRW